MLNTGVVTWNAATQNAMASVTIAIGGTPGVGAVNGTIWHDNDFDRVQEMTETTFAGCYRQIAEGLPTDGPLGDYLERLSQAMIAWTELFGEYLPDYGPTGHPAPQAGLAEAGGQAALDEGLALGQAGLDGGQLGAPAGVFAQRGAAAHLGAALRAARGRGGPVRSRWPSGLHVCLHTAPWRIAEGPAGWRTPGT